MTKILYNDCYGGFSVSEAAYREYCQRTNTALELPDDPYYRGSNMRLVDRTDPVLVAIVEEMGDAANGASARLAIRELPTGTEYRIDEYDGNETVMAKDEYDWQIA